MEKSDLMGRFDFDGAEGIAFWIGDSDTEPITKVMFDELETLKAFIEHNLPGMFGAAERDAATAAIERVAVEIEAVAGGITSSSEAAGYRNGLLRAAQIVRAVQT